MCDIWKESTRAEISTRELERHLQDLENLGVQWVVLSGGEPLMHSDLFRFCALLRQRKIRITLLSTGLLLERNAVPIVEFIDDVIVSLDGPPALHDSIRRVNGAFASLRDGVEAIHRLQPSYPISARSTIQRANFRRLRETTRAAKQLGLKSISFLATDLTSEAFNRPQVWSSDRQARLALSEDEVPVLEQEIADLIADWGHTGFVQENIEKLNRIVLHFRAHLGFAEPVSPRCNAPWISAVIEADGTVRPCFFHKPIGNLSSQSLLEVLNSSEATTFRQNLNVATNPVCQRCVCSLDWKSRESNSSQTFYTVQTT